MAKQQPPRKTTFADVFAQVKRTIELAQKAQDDGCDWPELGSAKGKFIAGMAAMERRKMPGGSFVKVLEDTDDDA